MKTILIGTTAINRPTLHRDNIPGWYNYINSLDRENYDIRWFINVDYIEKLQATAEETQNNFLDIITDINVEFVNDKNAKSGNFLNACKRVSKSIENYVIDNDLNTEDVIIFWLEDDWKLYPNNIPLDRLIKNYLSNLSCINLSFIKCNYIHALAPSVINYELWSQLHLAAWKQQKEHIDPEHCAGLYYIKHHGKYDNMLNITIITKYKTHNERFFDNKFFTYKNSYYTYDIIDTSNFILDRYVENSSVAKFVKNKITFMRVTSSFCADCGRDYMRENFNLVKNSKGRKNQDFYK